ncbi:MAG: NAD-dependent dehydratase, partial [Micrococcales bacterium]
MSRGKRMIIAGGSGSLGIAFADFFSKQGYEIAILTRRKRDRVAFEQIIWDGKTANRSWGQQLKGAVLLNLAGELVDRIPTQKNIELLTSSRV